MTTATKTQQESKTYRLRIGRLADGREAFAVAGYCTSALGGYRYVDVWVRDAKALNGLKLHCFRSYAAPGSPGYREMFALVVDGADKRRPWRMPLTIARQLGWSKP